MMGGPCGGKALFEKVDKVKKGIKRAVLTIKFKKRRAVLVRH